MKRGAAAMYNMIKNNVFLIFKSCKCILTEPKNNVNMSLCFYELNRYRLVQLQSNTWNKSKTYTHTYALHSPHPYGIGLGELHNPTLTQ